MTGFLPDDYKPPVTGKYMKFEDGVNRFRILGRELVHGRRHDFARAAPVGVEVHQHGHVGLGHGAIERVLGQHPGSVEQDGAAAVAALRPRGRAVGGYPVPGVTELAAQRQAFGIFGHRSDAGVPLK